MAGRGKPSVFIVEDETLVAMDIQDVLTGFGYQVEGIAKTGEDALEKIPVSLPDLVLMDIHLAGTLDGIETADRLHAEHHIPVIFLTAYADDALIERAKKTLPFGYIIKPFGERELHSVIEMALYKHRIEREIKKRDAILFAVSSAVEWLLRVSSKGARVSDKVPDFASSDIRDILEPIGLALDAGAIGIFQVRTSGPAPAISMLYEWGCPEYHSCLFKPELKQFTFSTMGISRWENLLRKGEEISVVVSTLSPDEQKFFSHLGAKAGVIIPIFIHDNLFGFIGFFDLTEKTHSPDEIEALRITANLLGAAIGYQQTT